MILKQNAGIDMSMEKFDVNLSVIESTFEKRCLGTSQFENNEEGFLNFMRWIGKHKDDSVEESYTLEFTGVYYEHLAYFLRGQNKVVHMVIPSKSKKYCESLSFASKTDKLDAQALAWMGLERNLRKWEPLSSVFLSLRTLTREREELLKEKTEVQNRLHAAGHKADTFQSTIDRYKSRLNLITEQVQEIEKEMKVLIHNDERLNEKFKNVITIPGVALITAATIIAETNGFSAILNQKQLTSYAGLDVKLKESGKYKGKTKISKQGNAHIRRILHFPAQTAIIYNPPMTIFYERVNARKEKSMIAGVGVQRKLLCLIYIIWKTDRVFDPNYEKNKYYYKKVG
jgi:transposase